MKIPPKKEIYEILYPETKKGAVNQYTKVLSGTAPLSKPKSFIDDSAEKMGVDRRTVGKKIQIAKNLVPEVKAIVKERGISEKNSLKLARIKEPEQQKKAAEKLASGEPIEKATKSK